MLDQVAGTSDRLSPGCRGSGPLTREAALKSASRARFASVFGYSRPPQQCVPRAGDLTCRRDSLLDLEHTKIADQLIRIYSGSRVRTLLCCALLLSSPCQDGGAAYLAGSDANVARQIMKKNGWSYQQYQSKADQADTLMYRPRSPPYCSCRARDCRCGYMRAPDSRVAFPQRCSTTF